MAQVNLGKVVPSIEITDTSNGKNVKFTTATQTKETLIEHGVSPIVNMSTTTSSVTISVKDVEGTKKQTVEKGTAVYYNTAEPTTSDCVVWIS